MVNDRKAVRGSGVALCCAAASTPALLAIIPAMEPSPLVIDGRRDCSPPEGGAARGSAPEPATEVLRVGPIVPIEEGRRTGNAEVPTPPLGDGLLRRADNIGGARTVVPPVANARGWSDP